MEHHEAVASLGRSRISHKAVCWCDTSLSGGHRMRLVPVLLVLALIVRPLLAQAPDSARPSAGTTISGIVHDSISRRPLAGAAVQLVAPEGQPSFVRATETDSLGRY